MPTNSAHPLAVSPLAFLDLWPTLSAADSLTSGNAVMPLTVNPTTLLRVNPTTLLRVNLPPLELLLLADRLAALYAMLFPDDETCLDEVVDEWRSEAAVMAAVERFLSRVNALFPVHEECWEFDLSADSEQALESIEWRLYDIPVIAAGFDEYDEDWEEWQEPVPYLLHMSYARHDDDAPDDADPFKARYPAHGVARALEPLRQIAALREMKLPEPLDGLPDLLAMLAHDTGNWWLDMGELAMMETGGYPPWTAENVAWLAAEWAEAQPVLARVNRLLAWRNGSPEEIGQKLTAVQAALLAAQQEEEGDE